MNTFSQPLKRRKISSVATTWKYVNTVLSEEEKEWKMRNMTGARAITKLSPCNNYVITLQYPCFHLSISMLFGRFPVLFGRKKSVIFPPVLQCSDGQSVAEWARIAYLRTDFLAWISFVNKLTFCAMEWKDPLSSPCKGEARYRDLPWGRNASGKGNQPPPYRGIRGGLSFLLRARPDSRKWLIFDGRKGCEYCFCSQF